VEAKTAIARIAKQRETMAFLAKLRNMLLYPFLPCRKAWKCVGPMLEFYAAIYCVAPLTFAQKNAGELFLSGVA
jgi:hypothetical protein